MAIRSHELNMLKISKGTLNGSTFPIWDVVPNCESWCVLFEKCDVNKEGEKCNVQVSYLRTVLRMAMECINDENTDNNYVLQLVGLNLMPLYKQLVSCKIVEHGLGLNIVEHGKTGSRIHPVLKEIRMIIQDIDRVWNKLGFGGSGGPMIDPFQDGESDFYDSIKTTHNKKEDEVRKDIKERNAPKERNIPVVIDANDIPIGKKGRKLI